MDGLLFCVVISLSCHDQACTNNQFPLLHLLNRVCHQSLANSRREVDLEGRLLAVIDTLTNDVYSYTCLGLFERHKLMLSFQMAVKILEAGPNPLEPQVRMQLADPLQQSPCFETPACEQLCARLAPCQVQRTTSHTIPIA